MDQPTVCAVMLTRDRPELAAKAVECFRRQTYQHKALVIWDTSKEMDPSKRLDIPREWRPDIQYYFYGPQENSIGALRNHAVQYGASEVIITLGDKELTGPADIIVHLDDDDWSHPNRISEQVALLQSSGADVVGYSEMLYWREPLSDVRVAGTLAAHFGTERARQIAQHAPGGEAWLFQCAKQLTPALGTSLCYWRKTWERTKFADLPKAPGGMSEYRDFLRNNKVVAVSSLYPVERTYDNGYIQMTTPEEPRMIARIHGGNFMPYNIEEQIERGANAMPNEGWLRVPEFDARVKEILK